jgi:hypothetical protein
MTKAEQREAAEVLMRVVERIDQGEVVAPGWLRERLVGAMLVLDSVARIASRPTHDARDAARREAAG